MAPNTEASILVTNTDEQNANQYQYQYWLKSYFRMQGDTTVPMLGKITLAMALGQGMITECSRL
jgi:hypothetical protein